MHSYLLLFGRARCAPRLCVCHETARFEFYDSALSRSKHFGISRVGGLLVFQHTSLCMWPLIFFWSLW